LDTVPSSEVVELGFAAKAGTDSAAAATPTRKGERNRTRDKGDDFMRPPFANYYGLLFSLGFFPMPVNDRLDAADWQRVPSSFFSGVNGRAAEVMEQNILILNRGLPNSG
jgi:hypothetical protein